MSIYSSSILIWQEKVSPLDTATTAVVTFAESDHSAASVTELRTFLGVTKLSDIWVRVTGILK